MILINLIPFLLLVISVKSGIVLSENNEHVKRDTHRRGSYKYNHPPAAEYFSVPVSVVYEEGNRNDKSVHSTVSTPESSDSDIDSIKTSIKVTQATTLRTVENKTTKNNPTKILDKSPSSTLKTADENTNDIRQPKKKSDDISVKTTESSVEIEKHTETSLESTVNHNVTSTYTLSDTSTQRVLISEDNTHKVVPTTSTEYLKVIKEYKPTSDFKETTLQTTDSTLKNDDEKVPNDDEPTILTNFSEQHIDSYSDEKKDGKFLINMPRDGLIIPVAVIYDVEPEVVQRHKNQRITVRNNPRTRSQRNKNAEITPSTEREKSKPRNSSSKESIKTANVSKIIAERDPIVPIIQSENNVFTQSTENTDSNPRDSGLKESIKTTSFPKRTAERDPIVPIIQSENYVFSHSGDFRYSYEGGDGTKAFERGGLSDNAGEAVEGSFSYIGKDGKDYSLTYTADENGYRPVGAHLPTPPPIPPAIARALKYLATKKPDTVTESYE